MRIDKVDTATVLLSGSDNLGGIGPGELSSINYGITNQSTSPAYVFIRIEMATPGLYEIVGSGNNTPDGWCRVSAAENDNEIILAYGELGSSGSSGNMTPVEVGESESLEGRLHCLADVVTYSSLSSSDMDIDVHGCLVYGTDYDGGEAVYNTGALSLCKCI